MKFPKRDLIEMTWGDTPDNYTVLESKIVDQTRWAIHYEMIFQNNDKYYKTEYSRGSTEYQDESPYQFDDDMIECKEVRPQPKTIIEYVDV
jgi:hypothetical protein